MIKVLTRIASLRRVLARLGQQPYLRGRALQVGGGALLADGLVGLENPLDRRDKRPGILGAVFIVVIAVVILFFLGLAQDSTRPYDGGATAVGTITSIERGTGTSSRSCSGTVSYTVDGASYQVATTSSSSSLCSQQGQSVDVSYRPAEPAAGRVQLGGTSAVLTVARVVVWVLLVVGVLTVVVRAAEIVVGLVFLVRGRRLVRTGEPVPVDRLLEEMKRAWASPGSVLPAGHDGP